MMAQVVLALFIVGSYVTLYWRFPGLRQPARRIMPFLLTGIGVSGLVLAQSNSSFDGQEPQGPADAWRAMLVLQSIAVLAAGLWLAWRPDGPRPLVTKLMNRSGRARWNLLLPLVVALLIVLLDHAPTHPLRVGVLLAIVIVLSLTIGLPAVAADLAAIGVTVVGLTGIAIAAIPPTIPLPNLRAVPSPVGGYVSPPASLGTVSGSLDLVAAVQGAAILAFGLWLMQRTIGVHARGLLRPAPDAELAGRVEQLTQTRADAVDSAAAELRRVERDLHDGAQARLVALGMNLRAAERLIHSSPQAAVALVAEAREASSLALTELRDLVRGIYPPVLADRGLGDAVRALALDTPIRTETEIDLPGRLDVPVESACYFAIAEALANAVKHSGARLVQIRVRYTADPRPAGSAPAGLLRIEVIDNGTGGADPADGTGLAGIERRLGTFDGILAVSSPPGGPTMIIMEVPCALSSPRTSSC